MTINATCLCFISFLILCTACSPKQEKEDGIVRRYHKNGALFSETTFRDGLREGRFRSWYDNGQLHEESFYKNDSLAGPVVSYYKNGNKNNQHTWSEDHEFQGLSLFWYENGVLGDSGRYDNGKLDGEWRHYYQNGRLKEVRNYVAGSKEGLSTYLAENGDTLRVERYRNNILEN